MGIGALPERFFPVDEFWKGTDNSSWLMRFKKRIQYRFVLGPRDGSAREIPKELFKKRGWGFWRYENTDGSSHATEHHIEGEEDEYYLSRIQPWSRWGIILQWPLFLNFWIFWRKSNVVYPMRYKSDFGITKLFTFHIGYKRDGDRVYWPTVFIGGNFE